MKQLIDKKEGYAYLINWVIRIGDLLLINIYFVILYQIIYRFFVPEIYLTYNKQIEGILLVNFSYFVTSTFIRFNTASNFVTVDKIIQRSSYFITLFYIIVTGAISVFDIVNIPIMPWLCSLLVLGFSFTAWHVIFRIALKRYRRRGFNFKQAVILGGGNDGVSIFKELTGSDFGYKIVGYFDTKEDLDHKEILPLYLGSITSVPDFLTNHRVDEVYCTLPANQDNIIRELIPFCEKNMIRFFIVPEFYKYLKRRFALYSLSTIPVLSLRYEPLQHTLNRFIKRSFDIIFSLLILIFIFPFIYIIFGIAIKISSSGPILFKQKRTGIKGHEFDCYKFRSMRINNSANTTSATKQDPRITRVGAFMRKTSIDELPQFLNVLKGDMSVVGPRPHMLMHTSQYSELIEKFMVRHLVKPGITGWAQVNGFRGETKVLNDMERRVKNDVWYIENWSFFLDTKIIFKTVFNVFVGEDKAY